MVGYANEESLFVTVLRMDNCELLRLILDGKKGVLWCSGLSRVGTMIQYQIYTTTATATSDTFYF